MSRGERSGQRHPNFPSRALRALALSIALGGCRRAEDVVARHPLDQYVVVQGIAAPSINLADENQPSQDAPSGAAGKDSGFYTRVRRLGALETPTSHVFDRIAAVAILPRGRLAVLDGQRASVRLFESDGSFLHEVGGPGLAEGSLAAPTGMFFHDGVLWVGDQGRHVHRFRLQDQALRFEGRFRIQAASPSSMCMLDGALFVHGVSLKSENIIHKYSLAGRHLLSFGKLYASPTPVINLTLSRGAVVCAPPDVVLFVPDAGIGLVQAYSVTGQPRWHAVIKGLRAPVIAEMRDEAFAVVPGQEGTHTLASALVQEDGKVLVQFVLRRGAVGDSGLVPAASILLDPRDGRHWLLSRATPLLSAAAGAVGATIREEPYPHLEILSHSLR